MNDLLKAMASADVRVMNGGVDLNEDCRLMPFKIIELESKKPSFLVQPDSSESIHV